MGDEATQRINAACYHIHDAIDGVSRSHPKNCPSSHRAYMAHLRIISPLLQPILLSFICVSLFEQPLWCVRAKLEFGIDLCSSPLYPSFELPQLTTPFNLAIELSILGFLFVDFGLLVAAQGWKRYLSDSHQCSALVLFGLTVADACHTYSTPTSSWRAAPYLRAGLCVVHIPSVRFQARVPSDRVALFFVGRWHTSRSDFPPVRLIPSLAGRSST